MTYEEFMDKVAFGEDHHRVYIHDPAYYCRAVLTIIQCVPKELIPPHLDEKAYQDFLDYQKEVMARKLWDKLRSDVRGECHNVHEPLKNPTFWLTPHFKCSECGAVHVSMEYVHFCPNCGAKVVDE